MIRFAVAIQPVAQPRGRATAIPPPIFKIVAAQQRANWWQWLRNATSVSIVPPKVKSNGVWLPHPIEHFKREIAAAATKSIAGHGCPWEGAIELSTAFVYSRRVQDVKKTLPNPALWKDTTPDFDNLAKGVADALTGSIWRDDGQVARSETHLIWGEPSWRPMVVVEAAPLEREVDADTYAWLASYQNGARVQEELPF